MVLLQANTLNHYSNFILPEFKLKNIDSKIIASGDLVGQQGILVAFICNHCPYVKAIIKDLVKDSVVLQEKFGITTVAINPNDFIAYPEDSFENMGHFASQNNMHFPYLIDETQEIAKLFNAVCTPDFFLFIKNSNQEYALQYKGRLNNFVYTKNSDSTSENFCPKIPELLNYVECFLAKPMPSIGCSIKWKNGNC